MKKNYTRPVVEVRAFDFEDIVMESGVSMGAGSSNYTENVENFKNDAGEGAIVVEW